MFIIIVNNKDYFLGIFPGIGQKQQSTLYDTSIKLETSSHCFKNKSLLHFLVRINETEVEIY